MANSAPTLGANETRKRLIRSARAAEDALVELARKDVNTFCAYVLRDERTGKRIVQAPYHEQWHKELDDHDRLIIWGHTEAGKSQQITIGRTLWELGRNPELCFCIVSGTAKMGGKLLKSIANYIEHNDDLHRVFPNLRPGEPWWPSTAITIRRHAYSKDPSVQCVGFRGAVLGSRIDRFIFDDLVRGENVRTEDLREEVYDWLLTSSIYGRLLEGGRVVFLGQAWHPKDAMHRLAQAGWPHKRYPVMDEKGVLAWPSRWSRERIERWKKDNPSHGEFLRQMLCHARDDIESRFRQEWIELCKTRGDGLQLVHSLDDEFTEDERLSAQDTLQRLSGDCAVYTGVDLGIAQHEKADLTVFFTAMLHPNGDRQILNIEAGRWSAMEIMNRAASIHRRFGSILVVENNHGQDYLCQLIRSHLNMTIPVRAFTTGRNKAHPEFGVESLGAEMEAGRWIIPNEGGRCDSQVDSWIMGLLSYLPTEHTSDYVMASWLCREGMRGQERARSGDGSVGVRVVG